MLKVVLEVFPLDTYVEYPVNLMGLMPRDVGKVDTPIWDEYTKIVEAYDECGADIWTIFNQFQNGGEPQVDEIICVAHYFWWLKR